MEKLIKKLTLVGEVNTNSVNIWWDIYDYILNGNKDIQDVEVSGHYHLYGKEFDVKNEDEWITFDECRDIKIKIKNNSLCVCCTTYTPKNVFSQYKDKEWSIKLTLPMEFIKKFETLIDYQFEKFCENSYKEYLETMRLQWIKNFKEEMLG